MQDEYGLTGDDRVLQKTPSSFDVSVWEFFWPLITGAALVVARPDGHKDPVYLAELIQEQAITTVHFVPSMLQLFLAEPSAAGCLGLRRVMCSGEALPAELAAAVPRRAAGRAAQPVRADGGLGRRHRGSGDGADRPGVDRPSGVEHACVRSGRARCVPFRRAWQASCTWPVCSWPAAISAARG